MLYLGQFSFNGFEDDPRHGYLSSLVDADSIDEALDRFRTLLEGFQREHEGLKDVADIYLDVVIQIKKVPPEGILAHLATRPGGLSPAISSVPAELDENYCEAYSVAPAEGEEGREVAINPFVSRR